MDSQEIGTEILNSVIKAVDTGDYANLSKDIKKSVDKATKKYYEVHNTNNYYANQNRTSQSNSNYYANNDRKVSKNDTVRNVNNYYAQNNAAYGSQYNIGKKTMYASGSNGSATNVYKSFIPTPFRPRKIGISGGVLEMIFGGIGMLISAVWGMIVGILAAVGAAELGMPLFFALLVFVVTTFLVSSGISRVSLVNEFNRYAKVIGNRNYITYEELASLTGQPLKKVKKNIHKFSDKGYFAFFMTDSEDTTLMFDKNVYDQYLQAQAAQKERELQEAEDQKEAERLGKSPEIIREGTAYIKKIREVNDLIPGKEMSDKLYKLEEIMNRIFEKVQQDPASADELRKFMNYYLPTTTKLLDAYIDLDKQPVQGENIKNSKHQIEEAMDTINIAFENLLDSMFQDVAWDISSDISVMKTMMAQDGLTEDALRKNLKTEAKEPVATAAASAAAGAVAGASAVATQTENDKITLQF